MMGRFGIAALIGAGCALTAGSAEAETRLRLNYGYEPSYESYYPGPAYIPAPRYYYYELRPRRPMRWDPALRRRALRRLYQYDPNYYAYEPDYSEPEYIAPPRKKKKKLSLPSSKEPTKKVVTKDAAKVVPKDAPKETKAAKKSSAMSCDKASDIVTGYGFSDVKATSCSGSVYSFAAARDGKPYTIKLSAASGELTEVKKVK